MRFRSPTVDGFTVFAVAGTNTVSFGIDSTAAARPGLLGFAVERVDPAKGERYYLPGFKVFRSVIPLPDETTSVSTYEHPVQSFVWDDFTAAPGHAYSYLFHPLRGAPKALDRSASPVQIDIKTEPLFGETHNVFFNRGVASSQAYARRFGNQKPDDLKPRRRQEALNWLSRDLDDALIRFIRSARRGNELRGAFYEFTYAPVLAEFARATARGVDVKLIVDKKANADRFPLDENTAAIDDAHLPDGAILARTARVSSIAHNKFLVLSTGRPSTAQAVWTGSTNLTAGGVHGQANVGHWVVDAAAAALYRDYWELLAADPGGHPADTRAVVRAKNAAFLEAATALSPAPPAGAVPVGITPVFSPRTSTAALDLYADLLTGSQSLACATFAFSIDARFKNGLVANTPAGPLCFLLLEKRDAPRAGSKTPFVRLNAKNNVYQASGSDIGTQLGQWVVETDNRQLGLNSHVAYMHCKFLLSDPLGADPIVVTGSANFSVASTTGNDENMVIIRGDRRVADIYFTEFNRLFNHYYARAVLERTAAAADTSAWDLVETDAWLAKYAPGTLRTKRVEQFRKMAL